MSHYFEHHPDFSVRQAYAFADRSHAGVARKYTGLPYITHPVAVARLVTRFDHDVSMIRAALLHDVIEDCGVSVFAITMMFGADTARLVSDLSDVSRPEDGNRAVRKAIDLEHTAAADPRAKTIKCMDLVHNTASIVKFAPGFARVYLPEKARILERISDCSDPRAHALAMRVLERSMARLERATTAQDKADEADSVDSTTARLSMVS